MSKQEPEVFENLVREPREAKVEAQESTEARTALVEDTEDVNHMVHDPKTNTISFRGTVYAPVLSAKALNETRERPASLRGYSVGAMVDVIEADSWVKSRVDHIDNLTGVMYVTVGDELRPVSNPKNVRPHFF